MKIVLNAHERQIQPAGLQLLAWFKNGLFSVTQTTGILPPGKGGFATVA
jgi:hypothetical protein